MCAAAWARPPIRRKLRPSRPLLYEKNVAAPATSSPHNSRAGSLRNCSRLIGFSGRSQVALVQKSRTRRPGATRVEEPHEQACGPVPEEEEEVEQAEAPRGRRLRKSALLLVSDAPDF